MQRTHSTTPSYLVGWEAGGEVYVDPLASQGPGAPTSANKRLGMYVDTTTGDVQALSLRSLGDGWRAYFAELHAAGFIQGGGQLVCTYFDENFLGMVPAEHVEGLVSCLDYYQDVADPFSRSLLAQYDALYPGDAPFTGGSACSGLYRGIRLWAAAVEEAGSLAQADVVAALDRGELAAAPGGPAAMAPGEHHLRLPMYIARARAGRFEVVHDLGAIDPQERLVQPPVPSA